MTAEKIGNSVKNNIVGSGRINALAAIDALFYQGPTNLTADLDGENVTLNWVAAQQATSYSVYRDGLRIANELTSTTYTDHLNYGGKYTYYINATLGNGNTSLPSNYITIEKEVVVETEVINATRVELSWNMPSSIFDSFESGDFYQNMWINDASYPWVITSSDVHSGSYCAKSTNMGMFTKSELSLGVSVPVSCVVSYYARISCFPLNAGGFLIDNVQYGETLKDEVPWRQYIVKLSPGNHLLKWKYINQLSEGGYENAFYIDDITVGNIFDVYRANCNDDEGVLVASNVTASEYVDYQWASLPIGQYKYGISYDGGYTIAWSDCIEKDYESVAEASEKEISLYPNPVRDELTIECVDIQIVTVVNMLGEIIFDKEVNSDKITMQLTDYQAGMYFVNILSGKGMATKKITVLR